MADRFFPAQAGTRCLLRVDPCGRWALVRLTSGGRCRARHHQPADSNQYGGGGAGSRGNRIAGNGAGGDRNGGPARHGGTAVALQVRAFADHDDVQGRRGHLSAAATRDGAIEPRSRPAAGRRDPGACADQHRFGRNRLLHAALRSRRNRSARRPHGATAAASPASRLHHQAAASLHAGCGRSERHRWL